MRRYRVLKFTIDSTRNILSDSLPQNIAMGIAKKEMSGYLKSKYGETNFDDKFKRYMSLQKPVLSVVEEHSYLLEDICDAYVNNSLYSALTGACCLGERIFNNIIFKVMDDFKSSPHYKVIFNKDSIIDWDKAINILTDWRIIDDKVKEKYLILKDLRNESVHYQKKDQDLERMSIESINTINFIIENLFGLGPNRRNILIYYEVPGELYIKKSAEVDPLVKAFYIPCSFLVGPQHQLVSDPSGKWKISDSNSYEQRDIDDEEFVKMRSGYKI